MGKLRNRLQMLLQEGNTCRNNMASAGMRLKPNVTLFVNFSSLLPGIFVHTHKF
jgi:hypothetical protein